MSKKSTLSNSMEKVGLLVEQGLVNKENLNALKQVVEKFSFGITSHMDNLIDSTNSNDPIAKQFIPDIKELTISPIESEDPIGDETFRVTKGIIHRYPDRCLFTPVHVCPVYCRFCFRRETVSATKALTSKDLDEAYAYIKAHKELWEVILTGGDPFILKPARLSQIIKRLNEIEHIEIIRIHTRVPVVDPMRINAELIAAIKQKKTVYIVLHANHPKEFSNEAQKACANLVDAGIPMLSQSVLIKGLNDNVEVLSELMRCFIRNRIKPYYLHQCDLAKGTGHFRTTLEEGQTLMKGLRGHISGICQPTYVLDIPGGHGKVPIGPTYLTKEVSENEIGYKVEDYQGEFHPYWQDKLKSK